MISVNTTSLNTYLKAIWHHQKGSVFKKSALLNLYKKSYKERTQIINEMDQSAHYQQL